MPMVKLFSGGGPKEVKRHYQDMSEEEFNKFIAEGLAKRRQEALQRAIEYRNGKFVDFSNPASVARMQVPYVGNNAYANPNIQYPPNYYAPPMTYNYSWSNNNTLPQNIDTAKFMIPLKGDKRIPHGKIMHGEPPTPPPSTSPRLTYTERKMEALRNLKVTVERPKPEPETEDNGFYTKYQNTSEEKYLPGMKYRIIYASSPQHQPHTPYTKEELISDYRQVRLIPDSPLNWTDQDEEEFKKICADVAVYDKAIAFVAWGFLHNKKINYYTWLDYDFENADPITREDYEFIKQYIQDRIRDFREKESQNQEKFNYRAKYRNRPEPAHLLTPNNELRADLSKPVKIAERMIMPNGDIIYDIDRDRDWLIPEEWDLFANRAFVDMIRGACELKQRELVKINKDIIPEISAQPQEQEEEIPYNPRDPVSLRLHYIQKSEREYNKNRDFFRHVFRHRLTDEEFDNWWYGSNTAAFNRARFKQMTDEEKHKIWAKQMTANNIRFLNTLQPIDVEQEKLWANAMINRALYNYHQGQIRPDMSLGEFMQKLRYLGDYRIRELEAEEARRRNFTIKDLPNPATSEGYLYQQYQGNPNPYYNPIYGTIDPRMPQPNQIIDLNQNQQQIESQMTQSVRNNTDRNLIKTLYKIR